MQASAKIDYSKLLGFNMLSDELAEGIDFQNATIGAKLGAKVGTKDVKILDLPLEVAGAGVPIMQGLGGRKIAST